MLPCHFVDTFLFRFFKKFNDTKNNSFLWLMCVKKKCRSKRNIMRISNNNVFPFHNFATEKVFVYLTNKSLNDKEKFYDGILLRIILIHTTLYTRHKIKYLLHKSEKSIKSY